MTTKKKTNKHYENFRFFNLEEQRLSVEVDEFNTVSFKRWLVIRPGEELVNEVQKKYTK
jgi:hypothetical protein